ncbi:hypothetical protein [Paenibacillus harenae]|uniref:hypothetical protein n=1 Tax=Paenibacillus harenae TaxID=306543 RepID=UPI000404C0D0|nr:hypothetical protein [Paenibacillus harenae]
MDQEMFHIFAIAKRLHDLEGLPKHQRDALKRKYDALDEETREEITCYLLGTRFVESVLS